MSGAKPHQNDLLLPGQQVVVIPLWSRHCEHSDESLLFTEADIVGMLFSSGTLLCQDVRLNWQTTVLDTWKATQLNVSPRESVHQIVCWWAGRDFSRVCLLAGCLTSQQHASVFQGRICTHNCTCCHNEIEVADPTFYLTQSQYTDTGPTSPSADPIMPGAWQGSHWSTNF